LKNFVCAQRFLVKVSKNTVQGAFFVTRSWQLFEIKCVYLHQFFIINYQKNIDYG